MSVVTNDRRLLTPEQIEGLAPDHATLRGARELAGGAGWESCGYGDADGRLLWAEFPESRRALTLTTVSLPDMGATCSCAATRFPCRHVIALLLRDHAGQLPTAIPPAWCDGLRRDRAGGEKVVDPVADGAREAAVVAGMSDLRLWLGDLAREGLAGLPKRGRAAWQGAINRLEDGYALEAAHELRRMASIPGSGNDWPERLLPRLGRLALLCEAFRRLDELPPGERSDALVAAGYLAITPTERVADTWLVVGRVTEADNRAIRSRTWLRGQLTGRWARLDECCVAGALRGVVLPTGAIVVGELAFLPSAFPLPARPTAALRVVPGDDSGRADRETGIDVAMRGYSMALAANPWLGHYPLALHGLWIEPPATAADRWRLRDREGRLLYLPYKFGHGWRLLALSADRPLSLFGEWNGLTFIPASYFDSRWRAFASWRPVP